MLTCSSCKKRLRDGEEVIPVLRVVETERRGDFVGSVPQSYIHLKHLAVS